MPKANSFNADAARFGALLREIRERKGWTQRKLAQRAGFSATYIGIVEQGENVPSLSTILELTEVLGADVGDVMRQLAAARTAPPEQPG